MSGPMTVWEAGLRGGAIALLLLLAVAGLRDGRHEPAARYTILLDLCAIAFLIETAPPLRTIQPAWLILMRLLSNATPAVFLLWAASLDDAFVPQPRRWLPVAGMLGLTAWAIAADRTGPWQVVHVAAVALVAAGLWLALAGRATDLLEARRRFRLVLAIGAGLWIVATTVLGVLADPAARAAAGVVSAGGVLVLALAAALLRLRAVPQPVPVAVVAPVLSPVADPVLAPPPVPAAPPAPTMLEREDAALLRRLEALMVADRVYREEGLAVATLAQRLGIPEYRLRRLINQRLGHRNFTSFVNGYRLADAMAALADPSQAQVPVLTIALDAGFQSIGPFNRAFKAHTGQTPSEFRRDRLDRRQGRPAG